MFTNFVINSTSIFIVFLSELSNALMAPSMSDLSSSDALEIYLEENPNSNLSNLLNINQQKRKLDSMADDLLQMFLDAKAYNCEPVRTFLKQVLAGLAFEMTLQSCSKPEWINGWIVFLLEEGEPELMNAIDAGVGQATAKERVTGSIRQEPKNEVCSTQIHRSYVDSEDEGVSSRRRKTIDDDRPGMTTKDAAREAKRLCELVALEEAKKGHAFPNVRSAPPVMSTAATPIISSHSDLIGTLNTPISALKDDNEAATPAFTTVIAQPPAHFTTFDQILTPGDLPSLHDDGESIHELKLPQISLYNASISIFDDAQPGEKGKIRSKPTVDYLLQIESASSKQPGWMIARKYTDFETLHEVIRRISVISGVTAFTRRHSDIPGWKNQTKESLRQSLEQYLREALSHIELADSEGMKRFLEKDQGPSPGGSSKGVLGFPTPAAFENMGKGMLDVLASAPKGAAGGGKFLLDGMSGVFSGQRKLVLPKRASLSPSSRPIVASSRVADPSLLSSASATEPDQDSQDNLRTQLYEPDGNSAALPSLAETESDRFNSHSGLGGEKIVKSNAFENRPRSFSQLPPQSAMDLEKVNEAATLPKQQIHLPPLPSEIPDDYISETNSSRASISLNDSATYRSNLSTASSVQSPSQNATSAIIGAADANSSIRAASPPLSMKSKREMPPALTEQETSITVELIFAVIQELYTLSSAWNIRRALLTAAKSLLLRPGNPNLEAIRVLLHDTVIEANTTDAGLATHIQKLRENALPTTEELATWPPASTEYEQEQLRMKARKLLIEKGMPQALTSIMGAAATSEALGRVFDSLQVEKVARGVICAMMLQGIRAITQ